MAYYLYKKIRDKRRLAAEAELQDNVSPVSVSQSRVPAQEDNDHFSPERTLNEKTTDDLDQPKKDTRTADEIIEEKRAMRKYRTKIIAGLFCPMLVWALNKTMIAAALPFIASDFNEFSQLNWIIAAAELTATAFTAPFAQFADIFGRYWTLQASVFFMIVGSALCAGAPTSNFPMLLAGRGIQGLATAGTMILTRIVLSDKVSLKDNALNNTVFSLVAGVGYGIGPVVGGYLTSVSWRWCFIINIRKSISGAFGSAFSESLNWARADTVAALSLIGMVLTHFLARPVMLGPQDIPGHDGAKLSTSESFIKRLQSVDFGGQFLFLFGMGLLVLALTWAGAYYPWSDVKVLAPLIIGSILLVIFLFWEYLLLPGQMLSTRWPHQRPMVSLELLWTRNAGLLMYINFITGMAMYVAFYFVELYFTIVKNFGSDKAGLNLLYYLPGLGAGVYLAMFICNVWPRKTWYPLSFGTVFEALGITLLAASLHWGKLPAVYAMLALAGLGSGIRYMPNMLHAVGYYRQHIATIVSLMSLAISLGSTLASTIMLNIFNNNMSSAGISLVHGPASASSFSSIDKLPADEQAYVRRHAKNSIVIAFYGISSFMWLGIIAVVFLGNVNIKKSTKDEDKIAANETDPKDLTKGAYVGSLFRRKPRDGSEQA